MKILLFFLLTILSIDVVGAQDNSGDVYNENIVSYLDVDVLPKFQTHRYNTALEYIYSNIQYPNEINVQGKVIASFVVTKRGKVEQVYIEKKLCNECDNEVQKILYSMPKWHAGKKNGKTVNTLLLIVVDFKLR
jgi:protein TonB